MTTVRFGLQKHFLKSKNEDVINSDAFSSANEMTKAVLVKLSKEGLGTFVTRKLFYLRTYKKFTIIRIFHVTLQNPSKKDVHRVFV
jgi:hypothetical protein